MCLTLTALFGVLRSAYTPSPTTEVVETTYDFRRWVKESQAFNEVRRPLNSCRFLTTLRTSFTDGNGWCVVQLRGFKNYHHVRIGKNSDGDVVAFFKEYDESKDWVPATGLKVLRRPLTREDQSNILTSMRKVLDPGEVGSKSQKCIVSSTK